MENHSKSILEILDVQKTEEKSKSGTQYQRYVCPSVIHQDDGKTAVGNIIMIDLPKNPLEAPPTIGKFYPVYEPRAQWDSPELSPALIRLVPVAANRPSTSVPASKPL